MILATILRKFKITLAKFTTPALQKVFGIDIRVSYLRATCT
ncbi:unnamed protein product [Acanthoscelides obtectus]|uniref:Uncharacterized protein n=1 Tax=Acanthoscelides obtectus TaxID=200917 RepID=A0A9P0KQS1_ACAOB|nr:unnamed protein product [Acanthoscelides obtectus]CAK1637725.1 hypothetical protein AOBTE_LOCUS10153 [Acanthoscelides obtectus]